MMRCSAAKAMAASLAMMAALSGCGGPPPAVQGGVFSIEAFFDGDSASRGEIDTLFFWSETFTADFSGTGDASGLSLDETFHFAPGDRLQRWDLKSLPGGLYSGTVRTTLKDGSLSPAAEVSGYRTAHGAVLGYDGYAPGGSDLLLHFRHWMESQDDGTVLNRVRISKFGIPIAGAEVVFFKVPAAAGS